MKDALMVLHWSNDHTCACNIMRHGDSTPSSSSTSSLSPSSPLSLFALIACSSCRAASSASVDGNGDDAESDEESDDGDTRCFLADLCRPSCRFRLNVAVALDDDRVGLTS